MAVVYSILFASFLDKTQKQRGVVDQKDIAHRALVETVSERAAKFLDEVCYPSIAASAHLVC